MDNFRLTDSSRPGTPLNDEDPWLAQAVPPDEQDHQASFSGRSTALSQSAQSAIPEAPPAYNEIYELGHRPVASLYDDLLNQPASFSGLSVAASEPVRSAIPEAPPAYDEISGHRPLAATGDDEQNQQPSSLPVPSVADPQPLRSITPEALPPYDDLFGERQMRAVCGFPMCGQRFMTSTQLRRHVMRVHVVISRHRCHHQGCNRRFSSRYDLERHLLASHSSH